MQVLATGGTGHLGAHVVAALLAAGHRVRVLARRADRVDAALEPLGWSAADVDVYRGDLLDGREALAPAMDGVDALLHAASLYSLNQADAARMRRVNVGGARTLLELACERGLSRVVYVSSYTAQLPVSGTLTAASPTGAPPGPYPASKAEAESIALSLADEGAPIVVTNPGMVFGPDDPGLGESTKILRSVLVDPVSFDIPGSFPTLDVRDVAAAHVRILTLDRPARRYLLAGHPLTIARLRDLVRQVTGRRQRLLPTPAPIARAIGRAADVAQRRGVDPGFSSMNIEMLLHGPEVDDHAGQEALGVQWRPIEQTIEDTVAWLYEAKHVTTRQAGCIASGQPVARTRA